MASEEPVQGTARHDDAIPVVRSCTPVGVAQSCSMTTYLSPERKLARKSCADARNFEAVGLP